MFSVFLHDVGVQDNRYIFFHNSTPLEDLLFYYIPPPAFVKYL